MRLRLAVSTLVIAAAAAVTVMPQHGLAQGQQQQLLPLKPPPPSPIKPYKPVAETPPQPYGDPSFQAFRKQLLDVAGRKDRAALAKLVVAQGFFWIQDKDHADPRKSGIDNLARAIDLDAKDGSGWDVVTGFANEPTAAELPDHKGVICGPADPTIDPRAFQALMQTTQTDPSEWGYVLHDGTEVRAAAQPNAPVIDKLGLILVRVVPEAAPPNGPEQPAFLRVALPSGKSGFIALEAISPLGGDQMCYAKDAGGWKIAGYFGGVSQ